MHLNLLDDYDEHDELVHVDHYITKYSRQHLFTLQQQLTLDMYFITIEVVEQHEVVEVDLQ